MENNVDQIIQAMNSLSQQDRAALFGRFVGMLSDFTSPMTLHDSTEAKNAPNLTPIPQQSSVVGVSKISAITQDEKDREATLSKQSVEGKNDTMREDTKKEDEFMERQKRLFGKGGVI